MSFPVPDAQNFSYLESLNPPQREAVEALDGPVLVLAGAGTGKTKVLTTRLAHLLTTGRAYPSQILAVTFTNKAAMEMKRRVSTMLGGQEVEGWWLGTFHSIAARILRRHAELVGLSSNFTILDPDDQARLMKQLEEAEGLDTKKWPPRLILSFIDRWKDRALLPESIGAGEADGIADGKLPKLYAQYQQRLKTLNACDFGDLLMHVITIFRDPKNKHILEQYQDRFRYILVDEYQDTNTGQYMWLRLLAQKNKNICCVGDDDQSIYGWRGAEVGNILKFEKDFEGAKVIRLEQNYRSTKNILTAANAVIAHNNDRLGKELWSADEDGAPVRLRGVWDGQQEAAFVAEEVESLQRHGYPLSEIAILVRAGHQTREFEERFIKQAIPYRVIGGLRFYERQEIRDAIAYLRVIAQPDDDLAFERIMNTPSRGLSDATLHIMRRVARARSTSLTRAAFPLLETDDLNTRAKNALTRFMDDLDRWRALAREIPHTELAQVILEESGYTAMRQKKKTPDAQGRLENLKELVTAMEDFDSIENFLEHVSLVMENQDRADQDMVSLMTLHSAKGLEFDAVFLPGWEEGLFPSQRTMDESGLTGLEEERRLAYVGITRARKIATITFAANRMIYGSWASSLPSRFIEELPKDQLDVMIDTGLYGSSGATMNAPLRGRSAPLSERDVPQLSQHIESESGFGPGMRVFHQKFGYGTILAVDNDKLDIRFEKAGRKKLIDSFVEVVT